MSLLEFWNMCSKHDYSYSYSDDHRYWKAGVAEADAIKEAVDAGGEEYENMYHEWLAHWWEKKPKPEKPSEG